METWSTIASKHDLRQATAYVLRMLVHEPAHVTEINMPNAHSSLEYNLQISHPLSISMTQSKIRLSDCCNFLTSSMQINCTIMSLSFCNSLQFITIAIDYSDRYKL